MDNDGKVEKISRRKVFIIREQKLQSIKKRFQHAGYPFNFIQKIIMNLKIPRSHSKLQGQDA